LRNTKNILIFIFAFIVIFAIGFTIYNLNDIQNRYAEEPAEKRTISTTTIYLYGLGENSLKLKTEFLLIKKRTDSIIEYEYKSKTDSTRNLKLSYQIHTQKLYFDFTEYSISEKNVLNSIQNRELWFDNYEMSQPIIDGMSPLIFNADYGILAIAGPLNPPIFFMDRLNDNVFADRITKILWK
jgi:hypothetical protein